MKTNIIGREKEIYLLKECVKSKKSEFVVIYGRRRVGKTFLVTENLSKHFVFWATGVYDQPKAVQLECFHLSMTQWFTEEQIKQCKGEKCPKTWLKMFDLLIRLLQITPKPRGGKKVVFLDELPWMCNSKSDFLPAFEHFWNYYAAWTHDIVLVVTGSSVTWIIDNIINNYGGLHNRQTKKIRLMPFTLSETEKFLRSKGFRWNRYDIVQCYMCLGGIPYYLDNLPTYVNNFPAAIDETFFREGGILREEYTNLYKSLFRNSDVYRRIIETLAQKKAGLTYSEIIKSTNLTAGGTSEQYVENLEQCGFIRRYNAYGKSKRGGVYQLIDLYTLFYLQFVAYNVTTGGPHWQTMIDSPSRRAWSGYAFEQVCLLHIEQIRKALGFAAVNCSVSSWSTSKTQKNDGAQIDLVIERRDQITNLCEMKFSKAKYVIDSDDDDDFRNKINTFRLETGTTNALHFTMVTTYGVKNNIYSGIVDAQVTMEDLFREGSL